jgi:hypothetical protein
VRRAERVVGAGLLAAAVLWWLLVPSYPNYDAYYHLVWGREILDGLKPSFEAYAAPTQHPLYVAYAALVGLAGEDADRLLVVTTLLCLVALVWGTWRLGLALFGVWPALLATVFVGSSFAFLLYAVRAYVDVPFLALVVWAAVREAEGRRGAAGLLVLAGLLRPEGWILAGLLWLWRWPAADTGRRVRGALLVLVAPAIWCLVDLVVTGDPLHSLTGTRDTAQRLERITGLDEVPVTVPRRLGEILREPVLFGAAGGGLMALAFLRARVLLGALAGALALAAFCVLAAAGLPILGRYLLAPAAILAIFCGAGAFGWAELPKHHPWRRRWAWFGAATLAALIAFLPAQINRIDDLRDALRIQDNIQDDLHDLTPRFACTPATVPNHRPVPLLALWLDVDPNRIAVAQEARPRTGVYVVPSSPHVAREYILDPRDVNPRIPPPPAGFRQVGANASWRLFARCQ